MLQLVRSMVRMEVEPWSAEQAYCTTKGGRATVTIEFGRTGKAAENVAITAESCCLAKNPNPNTLEKTIFVATAVMQMVVVAVHVCYAASVAFVGCTVAVAN